MKNCAAILPVICLLLSFTACSNGGEQIWVSEEEVIGTSIVGGEDTQNTASTDTDVTKTTNDAKGESTSVKTDENGKTDTTPFTITMLT